MIVDKIKFKDIGKEGINRFFELIKKFPLLSGEIEFIGKEKYYYSLDGANMLVELLRPGYPYEDLTFGELVLDMRTRPSYNVEAWETDILEKLLYITFKDYNVYDDPEVIIDRLGELSDIVIKDWVAEILTMVEI